MDAAVIEWIRINVLREELVIETLREVRRRLAERTSASAGDRARLDERAKEISAQLGKLGTALLASDEKPATVLAMISEREKELEQIRGRLAAVAAAPSAVSVETRRMERDARKRLGDLRGLFDRNPEDARRALQSLLDGPLTMRPIGKTRGERRYEIKGVVNTGPMFTTDGVPNGIRTRVSEVKIRGPGPLDDGDQSKRPPTYLPRARL